MDKIKVLVFGSTGTGKTSLCNQLTGDSKPVTSSARGVTFDSCEFDSYSFGGKEIALVDTVGLNESDAGTVSAEDSFKKLMELLKKSSEGYSLLIHVMKGPRITKSLKNDYDLFVKKVCSDKIPVILVVTGCEFEDDLEKWEKENKKHFLSEFNYRAVLATSFAKNQKMENILAELREKSAQKVNESILENSLMAPVHLYDDLLSFKNVIGTVWNVFIDVVGLPGDWRIKTADGFYKMLLKIGVPEDKAQAVAKNELSELIGEVVDKKIKNIGKKIYNFLGI